ncbi:inner centromere protein [Histomonas meleagridis]|uniref:inner centromere protein n=1 Tax=Histomonas meleagridis TaxID=135588 RepID=UPI00355A4EED|nr:inner centromere protein [Histomonas meleagridis]KAH0807073.1 inner centromere protein [Histomonas meleagridis]
MGEEENKFEIEFTRHVLSLFGTLYDQMACPYLGPIKEYNDIVDDSDDIPSFDSHICDLRLRQIYSQLDPEATRDQYFQNLEEKVEMLEEKSHEKDLGEIVIGEKLAPRTSSGKVLDKEITQRRKETEEKSRKAQFMRKTIDRENRRMQQRQEVSADHRYLKDLNKQARKNHEEEVSINRAFVQAKREEAHMKKQYVQKRRQEELRRQEKAEKMMKEVLSRNQRTKRNEEDLRARKQKDVRRKS